MLTSRSSFSSALDQVDGADELTDALEGVVLTLDGDQDLARCHQPVQGDQPERGRAVEEDVVHRILPPGRPGERREAGSPERPSTVCRDPSSVPSIVARENRLRRALRAYLADHPVDYVFLDCPPSLGLITLNGLVAASEILVPIQCEYYALEGVSQLVRTINLIKGELNEDLEVSTVLLTMYDARTRLAAQVADEVRAYFTDQTLPTVIPRSVRISEAPSYGQTVLTYHPDSAGAVSYLEAAQEIARRGAEVAVA